MPELSELTLLAKLIDLAEELGFEIRKAPHDTSEHPGGALVRLGSREIIFLDPQAAAADQISVLTSCLRNHPGLENKFIAPNIREMLDAN